MAWPIFAWTDADDGDFPITIQDLGDLHNPSVCGVLFFGQGFIPLNLNHLAALARDKRPLGRIADLWWKEPMRRLWAILFSLLVIGLGYALGMNSRTSSIVGSTLENKKSSPVASPADVRATTAASDELIVAQSGSDTASANSAFSQNDHVVYGASSPTDASDLRREALEVALKLETQRTDVEQTDRLNRFIRTLEDPVRDGLAFYGVDRLPILGSLTAVRVLLNLYNGARHGEDLTDLKDACWSIQMEIEGYTSTGILDYGAGCGRTTGLLDGKLYVHAEVFDPKLRGIYAYLAFPLPDGTQSGDFQAFSVVRKKWEKVSNWNWTTISGEELKRHEEELRRRAKDSQSSSEIGA